MRQIAGASFAVPLLAWCLSCPVAAQGVMSNDQLLNSAHNAGANRQWVDAYGFLYAYIQRGAPELSDGRFRHEIEEAARAAYQNARLAGGGGGPGAVPAGVAGKGDFGGPSGGRPADFRMPPKPRQPRSYRLRCQGGGMMNARYRMMGRSAALIVSFGKSRRAAKRSYPGAGRCAWIDRPLRRHEPRTFVWRIPGNRNRIASIAFGTNEWAASKGLSVPPGSVAGILGQVRGRRLQSLVRKIRNGGIFDVDCYNNRKGELVVTRVY